MVYCSQVQGPYLNLTEKGDLAMREIQIGGRIRELRYKKGVTQETLAQAMSVTAQAVSKWEMGISQT